MIRYQLRCDSDHEFEAWFRDSATYDEQRAGEEITCPVCGGTEIAKAPMAPALARTRESGKSPERRAEEVAREVLDAVGRLREHVEEHCDYVGDEFPEEARRIHYGEVEERGIYGEASLDEARELVEEGIEFYRLPTRPRRDN